MKIEMSYKQGKKGYYEFIHESYKTPDFCRGGDEDAESSLGNIVYNAIAACVEFGKYSTEIDVDASEIEIDELTLAFSNAVAEFMDWDQEAIIDLKIDVEEDNGVWYNKITVETSNKSFCRFDRVFAYEYLNGGIKISYESDKSMSGVIETFFPYHAFISIEIDSYYVYRRN